MSDRLQTYHEFDHEGRHYRLVYDETYMPDKCCGATEAGEHQGDSKGSYCSAEREGGGAGEEDCEKWWREEVVNLDDGTWVALGCIVTVPCGGCNQSGDGSEKPKTSPVHCAACGGTVVADSLWGIVVENDQQKAEATVKTEMGS